VRIKPRICLLDERIGLGTAVPRGASTFAAYVWKPCCAVFSSPTRYWPMGCGKHQGAVLATAGAGGPAGQRPASAAAWAGLARRVWPVSRGVARGSSPAWPSPSRPFGVPSAAGQHGPQNTLSHDPRRTFPCGPGHRISKTPRPLLAARAADSGG
jgi:hypothetical protein